jgi:hypothetical protein
MANKVQYNPLPNLGDCIRSTLLCPVAHLWPCPEHDIEASTECIKAHNVMHSVPLCCFC